MQIVELFCDYKELIPASVGRGEIIKIQHSADFMSMTLFASFRTLIAADRVLEFETSIKEALQLDSFSLACKYTPDMFAVSYVPTLISKLKTRMSVVNGFLDDAAAAFDGDVLTLELKNGGYDLLIKGGIETVLPKLVFDEFSRKISVKLIGKHSIDENDYDRMMSDIYSQLPPYIPPEIPEDLPEPETMDFMSIPAETDGGEIIKGKRISGDYTNLCDLRDDGEERIFWGDIFEYSDKLTKKSNMYIITLSITDYTSSVTLKLIEKVEKAETIRKLKIGMSILVKGVVKYDEFDHENVLKPTSINIIKRDKRTDKAEQKRVELHLHTNMSAMDAVTSAADLVARAGEWGHTAVAITDHGVVQAFPEAIEAIDKLRSSGKDIKPIFGIEAYSVNDLDGVATIVKDIPLTGEFIIFDLETTGLSPHFERIIEIGAVRITDKVIKDTFSSFVNPEKPIPKRITELTGITDEMVCSAPTEAAALARFIEFCGETPVLVAHNAAFDTSFIYAACARCGIFFEYSFIDTV